ncbi:signal peptide peptidase SppA [Halovulum sp. GXIMD14793]
MNAIERDFYEERRRKRRRSAFWKGVLVTLLVLIGLVVFMAWNSGQPSGPHIAQFYIEGEIESSDDRDFILRNLRDNPDVRAVILRIDSPGGTVVGSEAIYEVVRQISSKKPVVAVMGEVAASGGYLAAVAADHIVAHHNTITGSIGVILEYPDVTGLMDTLGIVMRTYRSSDRKADVSPFRAPTAEGQAVVRSLTEESYRWFRDIVAEQRDLSGEQLDDVANGASFTGSQALKLGLVDQIGNVDDAVLWLESQDSTLIDLPIENWEMPEYDAGPWRWLGKISGNSRNLLGFSPQSGPRLKSIAN